MKLIINLFVFLAVLGFFDCKEDKKEKNGKKDPGCAKGHTCPEASGKEPAEEESESPESGEEP